MELSIVIPALNEAPNLAKLLPAIHEVAAKIVNDHEVVVVDGGSTDGTPDVAAKCGARVVRQTEPGYGGALKAGFAAAQGKYIGTMDADFSHRPEFLYEMRKACERVEVVIASRYVEGGTADMPRSRWLLSRILNAFFSRGLSLPFRDLSSGFRMYKRGALAEVEIESTHFEVLEEILIKLYARGFLIAEVPFHYAPRQEGRSHAKLIKFGLRLLSTFFRMWKLRNSIDCCDYDWRAHNSIVWPQRYWQRKRFEILTGFARGANRTLDVGCGSSQILGNLPGPIGVDLQLNKMRYLRRHGQKGLVGDLFALPIRSQSFDCVICSEVIEHVPNNPVWLEELIRVLEPGGRLIIGTPDYGGWSWPIIEWIYAKVMPGGYAIEHITHYTRRSLTELLANHGFKPQACRYILRGEMIISFRKH